MDLTKVKTDSALELNGVRVPFGDATLLIARLNNPNLVAAYSARIRPYRGGAIPPATEEAIMLDCLAEHVLLGWENITNAGQPYPYNRDNARAALAIKDFAEFVVSRARDAELFRQGETREAVEAIAKN